MRTRLVLGSFTPSILLRVARELGQLAEQDLDVVEQAVTSSAAQFRALVDGQLDVVLTSPDNVLAYRLLPNNPLGEIVDVKIVSAVDRGLGLALFSGPGVNSVAELRGATFAVDVPNSGFAFVMYALAERLGLPRGEYSVMPLGSTPRRLAALMAGTCDATMLNAGNDLVASAAGCAELGQVTDVAPAYLGTVLASSGESDPEAVARLGAALRAASAAVLSDTVDDLAGALAGDVLKLPPDLARSYVRTMKNLRHGLIPDGRVDRPSMEAVVRLRRRFEPAWLDGVDLLANALKPALGLIAPPS